MLVAGHVREGDQDSGADPDFVPNAIREMHRHWIRGAHPGTPAEEVTQAIIVFATDDTFTVRINDNVTFQAVSGEDAIICDPGTVFVGQIVDIWPDDVDPDLAWAGFTSADGGRIVVVDYRRNRERTATLLARAAKFHQTAVLALGQGLHEPAVENAHSAAELAVMTLILLDGWNDKRNHRLRREWLTQEVASGSIPAEFAGAFDALATDRNAARYGEEQMKLDTDALGAALDDAQALIAYAAARRAG